jgi:hypothetical protein
MILKVGDNVQVCAFIRPYRDVTIVNAAAD